jgi:hypothetical protein
MRFSTNGGSSYDAGASDYNTAGFSAGSGGSSTFGGNYGYIELTAGSDIGNGASERGCTGLLLMFNPAAVAQTRISYEGMHDNFAGVTIGTTVKAVRRADQDTDGVRFLFSSGTIASGTVRMYGLR